MDKITASSVIYIDTNIFIYFIEKAPQFHSKVLAMFEHISKIGAIIKTSEITIAECLYHPAQQNNAELISIYENLFEKSGEIEIIFLNGARTKQAALYGGALGLKLIDSIHYISALEASCDFFITNDAKFKSGPKLKVILISAD